MEETMQLRPILNDPAGEARVPLDLTVGDAPATSLALVAGAPRGGLAVEPHERPPRDAIAFLRPLRPAQREGVVERADSSGARSLWALVPLVSGLRRNGVDAGAVAVLTPGDVIATAHGSYLFTRSYRATIGDVPAHLAECTCPVCGMALAEATVAACSCGAYYHEDPAGEDPLPCFSSVPKCGACGSEKSFEPRLLPDPADLRLL